MSKAIPYAKFSFILSVIGFIGSLGFYHSVLRGIKENEPQKELIKELKTIAISGILIALLLGGCYLIATDNE